jgi:hypothetical protein
MKKIFLLLGLLSVLFISCDQIDEWLTGQEPLPTDISFVVVPDCGSQLTDISQTIYCRQVPREIPIYRYRFIVKDAATNVLVGTVDKPVNSFSFIELGLNNLSLGKTYKVEVQVARNASLNFTSVINPNCTLRTPDLPGKSKVIIPACGSEINSLWRAIYALQSYGAEKYKFVVTNGTQIREYETTQSNFQLPSLPGGAAANTEYRVRVDIFYQGNWYQGDEVCTIFTSPFATLKPAGTDSNQSKK